MWRTNYNNIDNNSNSDNCISVQNVHPKAHVIVVSADGLIVSDPLITKRVLCVFWRISSYKERFFSRYCIGFSEDNCLPIKSPSRYPTYCCLKIYLHLERSTIDMFLLLSIRLIFWILQSKAVILHYSWFKSFSLVCSWEGSKSSCCLNNITNRP